jgi:hypothetical protein
MYKGDLRKKPDFNPFDREISRILDKIILETDHLEIW